MKPPSTWTSSKHASPRLLLLSAVLSGSPPNLATAVIATCRHTKCSTARISSKKVQSSSSKHSRARFVPRRRSDQIMSGHSILAGAGPTDGESPVQGSRQRPTARGPLGDRHACGADTSRLAAPLHEGRRVVGAPIHAAPRVWRRRIRRRQTGGSTTSVPLQQPLHGANDGPADAAAHATPPPRAPRVGSATSNQQPRCSACRGGARAFCMQYLHWGHSVLAPAASGGSPRRPPRDQRREVPDKEASTEGGLARGGHGVPTGGTRGWRSRKRHLCPLTVPAVHSVDSRHAPKTPTAPRGTHPRR